MAHDHGNKQRPAKRRHEQGMLDETDPLNSGPSFSRFIQVHPWVAGHAVVLHCPFVLLRRKKLLATTEELAYDRSY